MKPEHKFIASSRASGAPSVLPLYKSDSLRQDRRAKSFASLTSSFIFVVMSGLVFIFFFVSIYWGTTFLQSHVDSENNFRGLPGTHNILRKWTKEMRGFGNPPGKHDTKPSDDPVIAEELEKLKQQVAEEGQDDAETLTAEEVEEEQTQEEEEESQESEREEREEQEQEQEQEEVGLEQEQEEVGEEQEEQEEIAELDQEEEPSTVEEASEEEENGEATADAEVMVEEQQEEGVAEEEEHLENEAETDAQQEEI